MWRRVKEWGEKTRRRGEGKCWRSVDKWGERVCSNMNSNNVENYLPSTFFCQQIPWKDQTCPSLSLSCLWLSSRIKVVSEDVGLWKWVTNLNFSKCLQRFLQTVCPCSKLRLLTILLIGGWMQIWASIYSRTERVNMHFQFEEKKFAHLAEGEDLTYVITYTRRLWHHWRDENILLITSY